MRIGVDAMGGDYAPHAAVLGAVDAAKSVLSQTTVVMFGDKDQINTILKENSIVLPSNVEIVHTTEVIEMGESPTQAFSKKKDSSIAVGFGHLQSGAIDAFASAGSTGAMMVGCMYTVKQIEGIIRPTIAAALPTVNGGHFLLLDVGLNIDCKPEVLNQYGVIGSVYANVMLNKSQPKVALLNIGEEEEKGNIQSKAAFPLLKENTQIDFIGNLEPKYILNGNNADVVVCDGFVGNLMLKTYEGVYSALQGKVADDMNGFFNEFNYENQGGTPVLGVNSVVIIGHGCSTPLAICNMVLQAEKAVNGNLVQKLKEAFC